MAWSSNLQAEDQLDTYINLAMLLGCESEHGLVRCPLVIRQSLTPADFLLFQVGKMCPALNRIAQRTFCSA